MLRRAEVADYEVDERDDPAMRLSYDGTDEPFIAYDERDEFVENGLNLPRKARLARAIFEQPAEEDGSRLVLVAEVGKRLVIRALSSHGKVASVEPWPDEKAAAMRREARRYRRVVHERRDDTPNANGAAKAQEGHAKATKAKEAKQPQLGRHSTRLLGLARELAERRGGNLIADQELRSGFHGKRNGSKRRRITSRPLTLCCVADCWSKRRKTE